MPFIANTPESLISRSDSKNPATTCRGITSGGRSCRRPLPASSSGSSVVLQLKHSNHGRFGEDLRVDDPGDERLYCWQHKEQANISARSSPMRQSSTTLPLQARSSLDTLAERLGLLAVNSKASKGRVPTGIAKSAKSQTAGSENAQRRSLPIFCCCFLVSPGEAPMPLSRPKPRPFQQATPTAPRAQKQRSISGQYPAATGWPSRSQHSKKSIQPLAQRQPSSSHSRAPLMPATPSQYLNLIQKTASPQMVLALETELAKPVSQVDEPGYIYMFWLTSQSSMPAKTARSLLTTPSSSPKARHRHGSDDDALFSWEGQRTGLNEAVNKERTDTQQTILLKIGRACNVHRRLNEWQRQCDYNLSLVRYYPYVPWGSSPSSSGSDGPFPRKVPHSHRVERLIHIELAGAGLRVANGQKCKACGREHREWFEVPASRRAVTMVDETIRRWTEWDEAHALTA